MNNRFKYNAYVTLCVIASLVAVWRIGRWLLSSPVDAAIIFACIAVVSRVDTLLGKRKQDKN